MQSLRGIFPRPKGPPKRDFIKENVKNLKSMQQHNNNIKQTIDFERNKPQQRKNRSTSHCELRSTSNSVKNIVSSKSIENVAKVDYGKNTRPLSVQSRDACSQTESVDDELFLKDVIIRLPSALIHNSKPNITERAAEFECPNNYIQNQNNEHKNEMVNVDGVPDIEECQLDHDQHNTPKIVLQVPHNMKIDRPIHQFSTRCQHSLQLCVENNTKPIIPSSYRKGEIPKYLKEMKSQEEERARLESLVDVNCPQGHTILTESERLESLHIAETKYQDLIDELNHMPLTSQTLRIRNRQIEIEKELRKLDQTIQIFSRSRVYVKNEE